jgi:hypothetical protein
MKCQQLINDARRALNDPEEISWSNDDLVAYLSDAFLALSVVRPDATAITQSIQLTAGTKQALPAGGLRLMRITRNMGDDGATPGRVSRLGDMMALDDASPDWHNEIPSATVLEYFYNLQLPRDFYVSPPVPTDVDVYVEASFSRVLPAIGNPETTDLPVDDVFAPALREWILYRAWGGDDESSPNFSQAQARMASFFQILGTKTTADMAASAKEAGK